MGIFNEIKAQFRPSPIVTDGLAAVAQQPNPHQDAGTTDKEHLNTTSKEVDPAREVDHQAAGVAKIEAVAAVWGKRGKYILFAGLAAMMIIFELDNSTVSTYQTYATSEFSELSMLATLGTVTSIISAVFKPPIAKLSDVLGRAQAYIFTITCYVLSYILCASSKSYSTYAGGYVFYAVGQTGTSILDSIMVSDLSSMRWRGFAYNIIYVPFLITPWISAFIVDSVVNGIGWRWGIGMFAILMPFCASFIIITLLFFQHRAKKAGIILTQRLTLYDFCSHIDLGGVILLSGGFAMLLLPITLAATTTSRWKTPWVEAVIVLGAVALACLYPYEKYVAKHPVVPVRYFKSMSIVFAFLLACIDNISFGATHTYLYAWSIVSHNFSARNALFLAYTNGVMQCLTGMAIGLVMYKTRAYKWIGFAGAVIRIIGYGVMIRLRTNNSSIAELFVVQIIQGLGSGIIETINVVAAQIVVPHAELAQVTSLVMLGAYLGDGIGSAVAGGIYTGTLKERLRMRMGTGTNETEIETLYNSITGTLPAWGTSERNAVDAAYSDVIGYISIAALAFSVPIVIIAFFMPNKKLGDGQNLVSSFQPKEPLEKVNNMQDEEKPK